MFLSCHVSAVFVILSDGELVGPTSYANLVMSPISDRLKLKVSKVAQAVKLSPFLGEIPVFSKSKSLPPKRLAWKVAALGSKHWPAMHRTAVRSSMLWVREIQWQNVSKCNTKRVVKHEKNPWDWKKPPIYITMKWQMKNNATKYYDAGKYI